jgi:hypothetical protein
LSHGSLHGFRDGLSRRTFAMSFRDGLLCE